MQNRREVDGLRAVAIVPVILFHAGFAAFGGGFVGVDVFFVISGYLISSLILGDLDQRRFSIVGFYERRARRILPSLFFVMLACLLPAWWWMLPDEFFRFSKSLVAVSTYSSNVLFMEENGYFEPAVELKPLLHTWSLAVEEQFYLVFPLLLLGLRRFAGRATVPALGTLALASLALAQAYTSYEPMANESAAFYLLPARAFELLIGVLVAFDERRRGGRPIAPPPAAQIASLAGLGLVALAIFGFDKNTPFPGVYALVPTLGTALVLAFGTPQTWVGRVLAQPLPVGIGLVSYSAYLWHQPLLAFARIRSIANPGTGLLLALAVLTFVLAYLSWRFVERPFRDRQAIGRRSIFAFAALSSALLVAVGLAGYLNHGFDRRTLADGSRLTDLAQRVRFNYGLSQDCSVTFSLSPRCRTSDTPEIAVWGDSYAMHLMQGLVASRPGVELIQLTKGGCAPVLGFVPFGDRMTFGRTFARACMEFNRQVIDWLRQHRSVKYVVVATPFVDLATENESKLLLADGSVSADRRIALELFLKTLDTIAATGATPVVFGPPPSSGRDNGRCLVKSVMFGLGPAVCDFPARRIHLEGVEKFLAEVGKRYRVLWVDGATCSPELCRASIDGTFVYGVGTHLSYEGSALVGRRLDFYKLITSP